MYSLRPVLKCRPSAIHVACCLAAGRILKQAQPLTSIRGYVETLLMKQDSLSSPRIREYLQVVHSDAKKSNEMVHELFELSKYEARQIEPRLEQFLFGCKCFAKHE